MLTFAVVVSRSGRRISERVLDRLRDAACPDVPFSAASHLNWSNDSGTVWFGGWQDAGDATGAAHHWHVDDDGLTAFAGYVWPRREGWRDAGPWAAQLAHHLRSAPLAQGGDDLTGIYIAMSLRSRGRSHLAADPLGIGVVYWGEGHDVIVISSRAALAAGLVASEGATAPKRDTIGAGWIAYGVRAMGMQTGFEAVTVVPQGAVVDIDASGGARLLYPSPPPWRTPLADEMSPDAALDAARREMTAFIRMVLALPGHAARAGLTGGKDSRLILALLVRDGSAGDVEFQTFGAHDLPDVLVARQIAESLGLRHVVNPGWADLRAWRKGFNAAVRDDGHGELSEREISFRVTAWACSGSRNVFEPQLPTLPTGDGVLLTGLFGETLRTNFSGSSRWRSKEAVANGVPTDMGLGSAGILRPQALEHYRQELHRLLFDGCIESDSPQDVVDAFFMRNWLRRWFAGTQEFDTESRVFPLYSTAAIKLAFAIGSENRHAEWIHYRLMHEACEALVHIPFADGAWSAGADGDLVRAASHSEPRPAAPPKIKRKANPARPWKRTAGRDRRAAVEAADVEVMRSVLRYDPSNPVFEIIDPVATRGALDGFEHLPLRSKVQLYGALTAAIWLGGHEIAPPRSLTLR